MKKLLAAFVLAASFSLPTYALKVGETHQYGDYQLFVGGTAMLDENLQNDLSGDFSFQVSGGKVIFFTIKKYQSQYSGALSTEDQALVQKIKEAFPDREIGQFQMMKNSTEVQLSSKADIHKAIELLALPAELTADIAPYL